MLGLFSQHYRLIGERPKDIWINSLCVEDIEFGQKLLDFSSVTLLITIHLKQKKYSLFLSYFLEVLGVYMRWCSCGFLTHYLTPVLSADERTTSRLADSSG